MKSISIRNVSEPVYTVLQQMARDNHRSLQEQIKCILEQEARLAKGSSLVSAEKWRKQLRGRKFTDTVKMIRQDRQR